MIRLIYILFLIPIFIFASTIDKKIAQNQKSLDSSKKNKDNTTVKIKEIADKIEASNTNLSKLEEDKVLDVFPVPLQIGHFCHIILFFFVYKYLLYTLPPIQRLYEFTLRTLNFT